jgi:hypothetical protein
MKLYHTAALALVGWYLMVPPRYGLEDLRQKVPTHEHAPLPQWTIVRVFDSARECEKALVETWNSDRAIDEHFGIPSPPHEEQAQCIATDDPRLKEK